MRLVADSGDEVADVVHQSRGHELVVVGRLALEEGGGLQRVVELRHGRPGSQRPCGARGQQVDDSVDAQAGRAVAHAAIVPHALPRCASPVAGTVTPHALGATATQPVDRQDGLARSRPRRRRSFAHFARPRRPRAAASATTGLHDFGDDWWEEPFRRLCASLEAEARLHLPGRLRTRGEIQLILQNRLRMVDLWKREPAVLR